MCKSRSCGESSVCFVCCVCCVCSSFACCLPGGECIEPLSAWIAVHCLLVCSKNLCELWQIKMSLQTVFKCPAKLYTLKVFTHNRIREHPKWCSFSLEHITICIVTQITYIFESGEFTGFVRHSCGQKLFKVTRVTVSSPPVRFYRHYRHPRYEKPLSA